MESTATLVMMRHGESAWNKLNLFTGWVDVPLSPQGIKEALEGGRRLGDVAFDVVYTSALVRAQMTALLALSEHPSGKVPVVQHPGQGNLESWGEIHSEETRDHVLPLFAAWELNERMYGELQGCNKAEIMEKFGPEQFKLWRRSYDIPPPQGESLELTAARTLPYFEKKILPHLQRGENVFICAHGNSLRSIIMALDNLSKEQVVQLEIPLGQPIFYRYLEGRLTRHDSDRMKDEG